MAEVGSDDRFQPDLLLRRLEDMLPFIERDDVGTLAHLAVEKRLIPSLVGSNLEAMHDSVTPRQKFRYLIWNMYSNKCSVDNFLRLLATLPSGESLARDYKSKATAKNKIKFVIKNCNTYNWLIKRFSDPKLEQGNEPKSRSNNEIILYEREDSFLFLLEGCAGPIESNVRYDWYKNNAALDAHSPFLCFKVTDIFAEGEYTIRRNGKLMASTTICLKTIMHNFRQDLTERYLETVTNVDEKEWPNVKQSTYINLAVIKSDKSDNLSSYVCQTIRGDADDIHGEKGETDYRSAFEGIRHRESVIVQGRPGSGKTTLVHKISQDWADHSINWSHVKALFLIHLRGFHSRPSINLRDFLLCYFTSEDIVKSIGDYITSKDGLGICFILDGLDEYQPDDKTTFVFKLIEKKVLSKAIVIVASRPVAVAKYRSRGKNIEVLGFFKKQISDYIDSYEFRSTCCSSMLKEYLTNRPNVHHMCYLPIQLAMICFLYDLFEEDGDEFPDTETDVYEQFTRHMLLRTFYRQGLEVYLESIFSLPELKGRLFRSICTLAFEKTLSSKQVLEQSEVDIFCEEMNTNSSLGLLTVDRKATKCGFQNMYTFCHLTFQEFLAACHICFSSEVNQFELIAMCSEKEHMTVVLKFFCGLAAGLGTEFCTLFKNVMKSPHLNCLAKIHCAYESKQPDVCQYVCEDSTLNVTENYITTRDWSCIGFIILHTSDDPIKSLSLNFSGITEDGIECFKNVLKRNKISLRVEKLRIVGSIYYIIPHRFLENFNFLRILSVTINETTEYRNNFFSALNPHNIKIIHYCENSISKLAVKWNFSSLLETLFSSYEAIRTPNNFSKNFMYIPNQILEVSLNSESPFIAKECKSLLSEVCASNKCIKLSCTKVKNVDNIVMIFESGYRKIISDIKYLFEIFADNHGSCPTLEGTLNCLDLISLANQIVLVYTQTSLEKSKVVIYILPKEFVIEKYIYNRKHATNIKNFFIKRIPDGMRLYTSGETPKLQNVDLRKMCIAKNDIEINKKLGVINFMSQSIEQLHINSIDENFEIPQFTYSSKLKCFTLHLKKPLNIVASGIINHNLSNLIDELAFNDLHILDMSHCNLSSIIDSFLLPALKKNWINLTELYLKNCSITEKHMNYIVEGIMASSHLNTLDLSDNNIGDKGCQALAVLLLHHTSHLQKLNLSCCHISDRGIEALAASIEKYCDIKLLDLSSNSCQSSIILNVFTALKSCKNLSVLNLSLLSIGGFSQCNQYAKYFHTLCIDQHILDLSHCNLSAIIDYSLLPALKDWINLTELYLKNCSITEKDMSYVVEGIMASSHLNTLDLSDNNIGDKGCTALAVSLHHECIAGSCSTPHLQKLNLSCCHITSYSCIVALAGFIHDNCDIELLDLSGNNCQSEVIPVLFTALQSCKNLSVLNLSRISIGNFSVFSKLYSNSVEVLNLCACKADLCLLSLAECTSLLSSLCVLDMSENNWPMTELARVLNHAHNLQELSLSQIYLASNDTKEFVRVLKLLKNLKLLRLSQARVHECNDFASIVKSETLEVFEIPQCQCSASDYFSLCLNIKHAPSLRTLDLSYIQFSEHQSFDIGNISKCDWKTSVYNDAAVALSRALPFCSNLQELKLRDCGIKQTGAKALASSILKCGLLISVDLSRNCFSAVRKEIRSNFRTSEHLIKLKI